jgi:hypothetical protein
VDENTLAHYPRHNEPRIGADGAIVRFFFSLIPEIVDNVPGRLLITDKNEKLSRNIKQDYRPEYLGRLCDIVLN